MSFPGFEQVKQQIIDHYLQHKTVFNNTHYDVPEINIRIIGANLVDMPSDAKYFKLLGIHWLTGEQNQGKHACYIEVLDPENNYARIWPPHPSRSIKWRWGWTGQGANESSNPPTQEKPLNELDNIVMNTADHHLWIYPFEQRYEHVQDIRFDKIENVRSDRIDGANGPGNTYAHHSFYAIWALEPVGNEPGPGPGPTPPGPEPQPPGAIELVTVSNQTTTTMVDDTPERTRYKTVTEIIQDVKKK